MLEDFQDLKGGVFYSYAVFFLFVTTLRFYYCENKLNQMLFSFRVH